MTCSTLNARTTTGSWKFEVLNGDSFKQFPGTHYIRAPTSQVLKQTIISTLEKLPLSGQNVIAQFWAPTAAGNNSVLTTTYQPAVIYGNNRELHSYHEAFLQQKYYINPGRLVAFGFPGRVFLTCKPEHTRNVHHYPEDQRPRGQYDFFSRTWGSYCVPVISDGLCKGVLEFVTDNLKDSYDSDIDVVRTALEGAGLQTLTQIKPLKVTNIILQKRIRKRRATDFTKYSCLVPYFGLSSEVAADRLGQIKEGTFRNICRRVGIPEWPFIPNNGSQIDQISSSETSSLDASDISDISELTDYMNTDSPEWSPEETTIATASSPDSSGDISNPSEFENIKAYFPECSYEQTTIARASAPETQNYHRALDEAWIKRRRECADFMQEFNDDLIDQNNETPQLRGDIDPVKIYFNLNEWENYQVQQFEPTRC